MNIIISTCVSGYQKNISAAAIQDYESLTTHERNQNPQICSARIVPTLQRPSAFEDLDVLARQSVGSGVHVSEYG